MVLGHGATAAWAACPGGTGDVVYLLDSCTYCYSACELVIPLPVTGDGQLQLAVSAVRFGLSTAMLFPQLAKKTPSVTALVCSSSSFVFGKLPFYYVFLPFWDGKFVAVTRCFHEIIA